MRTSFLLLSAALVLAACNDAGESTAPRSRTIVTSASEGSAAQYLPPGPSASGKPSPGFSSVISVESAQGTFGGAGNALGWLTKGTVTATCPAGTTVMGGGFDVYGTYPWDLSVYSSKPNGANGWKVTVENNGGPGSTAFIKATAMCIQ